MIAARDLFNYPTKVVGIYITNKCNFLCSHCCTDSGQKNKNLLTGAAISKYLADTHRDVEVYHISGGEPFMNPECLETVFAIARAQRRRIAINTNGFWVRSRALRELITANADVISDLHISYSPWHAEFASLANIQEALLFSLATVSFTELMLVHRSGGFAELLASIFPEQLPSGLHVSHDEIYALGRAKDLHGINPSVDAEGGCSLVNRPTIQEDGSVLMCCNTTNFTRGAHALKVGSIGENSLADLLRLQQEDLLVRFLRAVGPKIIDSLGGLEEAKGWDKCDHCLNFTRTHAQADALRQTLAESKWQSVLKLIEAQQTIAREPNAASSAAGQREV